MRTLGEESKTQPMFRLCTTSPLRSKKASWYNATSFKMKTWMLLRGLMNGSGSVKKVRKILQRIHDHAKWILGNAGWSSMIHKYSKDSHWIARWPYEARFFRTPFRKVEKKGIRESENRRKADTGANWSYTDGIASSDRIRTWKRRTSAMFCSLLETRRRNKA